MYCIEIKIYFQFYKLNKIKYTVYLILFNLFNCIELFAKTMVCKNDGMQKRSCAKTPFLQRNATQRKVFCIALLYTRTHNKAEQIGAANRWK